MGRTHPRNKTCRGRCLLHHEGLVCLSCLTVHPSLDHSVMSSPSANYPPANTPPANTPPAGTSPTKPREHTKSDTRLERSSAAHEGRVVLPVDPFQAIFLNFPDAKLMTEIAQEVLALLSKVTGAQDQASGYQAIPDLFNQITELLAKQMSYESKIHFSSSPTQHPHHHPCGNLDTPDFLAMLQDVYELHLAKPCWHYLVSLGEWKSGTTLTDDELSQTGAYAGSLNQARPDNPSGLVFSACRGCYVIGYSDPSTWSMSEPIQWDNLVPLIGYIHSLHVPRLELKDTTITLDLTTSQSPHWTIRDDAFNINDTFEIMHVGRPHSRMTTVFRRIGASQNPLLVKDSWVNSFRKPELSLFQSLTADGDAPGWVKIRPPAEDADRDRQQTKMQKDIVRRRKDRTVMENTGLGFEQCERLSDAIAAAYDVLEADRWAITKRRILHRDISPGNILIHPVVASEPRDGACFIRGVLDPDAVHVSSALLLDLDNGTALLPVHHSLDKLAELSKESTQDLRGLSGTPMYIARGPSKGFYEDVPYHFPMFPTLDAAISDGYTRAYQGDSLRAANGLVGTLDEEYRQRCVETRVVQRPWHDAESIMLTLLMFILRCSPEGSSEESQGDLKPMQHIYQLIRNDGIGSVPDHRDSLLTIGLARWKHYLHKDLHHLAQPISNICAAIYPDYEFLLPTSNDINVEVVLHEVLQRILLNLYHKITSTSSDVTFSKNLRPLKLGASRKQVFLPVTESKGLYALPGPTYVPGPSKIYVARASGAGTSGAGTSGAGTSAIHTGGKRVLEREESGEHKPPAKRRKKQGLPIKFQLCRSLRVHGIPPVMDSPEIQLVAQLATEKTPQPDIGSHGTADPPAATDEAAQGFYSPGVEPDTPQHNIEGDLDGSPRFTKQEKGKAPRRGE